MGSRKQKRVYVDEVVWSAIKAQNSLSTDSEVQDHIMAIYEMADALKEIHPNLRTAIGMALAHNHMLKSANVSAQVQVVIDGKGLTGVDAPGAETTGDEAGGGGGGATLSREPTISPTTEDSTDDW